jgi:hypothetical protein
LRGGAYGPGKYEELGKTEDNRVGGREADNLLDLLFPLLGKVLLEMGRFSDEKVLLDAKGLFILTNKDDAE